MRKMYLYFIIIFFISFSLGCGSSGKEGDINNGTNQPVIIGANGGNITSDDKIVSVIIPSGALSIDTSIYVNLISNIPIGHIGNVYELGPNGLTFNLPVTISIVYDESILPKGVAEKNLTLAVLIGNAWHPVASSTVDIELNKVSATATSFSIYGIIALEETHNSPPVAEAGSDQTVSIGDMVTLDGSGSIDADGDPVTYQWSFVSVPNGSIATLSNSTTKQPSFKIDVPGTYIVQLVVNDSKANSTPDTVSIFVSNTPPVAEAGSDQTVSIGDMVTLDGSGSIDADGDPVTYQWSFVSVPNGSIATLSNSTTKQPSFVVDVEGIYVISLVVDDGVESSSPDNIKIITFNRIGIPYLATDGLTVKLNSLSVIKKTSTYEYIIDYTLTNNTKDQIIDEGSFKMFYADKEGGLPQYGFFVKLYPGDNINKIYTFETLKTDPVDVLEYGDNFFALEPVEKSLKWKVVITDSAPIANAGPDQTQVTVGSLIALDGSGSTDADGDSLIYNWYFTSTPVNSSDSLSNPSTVNPSFIADVVGEYVLSLVVNDGKFDSVADVVKVTVATGVDGILPGDNIWDLASSPFLITSDVQIPYGSTLTIEPGVKIIGLNRSIKIFGTFNAVGTENSRIKFESVKIVPGSGPSNEWFKLKIDYAEVSSGSIYYATGFAVYGSISLRNSIITDIPMMYLWYPVEDCFIEQNIFLRTGGISTGHKKGVKVYIRNNAFYQYTGYGKVYAVENWASYDTSETIVEYNSFLSPDRITLSLSSDGSSRITAINNYWSTTDTAVIESMIYDRNDDLGIANYITYIPFLTTPDPNTPDISPYIQ